MNPRILIVDDHEVVREGIRTLISRARPDWQICGEAPNAKEAINQVTRLNPDLVILDITMPGMSGLEAAAQLTKLKVRSKILMFTMHESKRLAEEVRTAGAQGFVFKSQAARDLIRAIETILGGGSFFGAPPDSNSPGAGDVENGGSIASLPRTPRNDASLTGRPASA
jgi:DNA-binding NarL/FixJ family response regulator